MEDYFEKVHKYFQEVLEKDSLTNSKEAKKFEQALILLEEDPVKVNNMFEQDDRLKSMFDFNQHQLHIIHSETEFDSESQNNTMKNEESLNDSSDGETIDETVRIDNKVPFPEMHPGFATGQVPPNPEKKRKGPEKPFFPTPEKPDLRFDTTFGRNILNLDC